MPSAGAAHPRENRRASNPVRAQHCRQCRRAETHLRGADGGHRFADKLYFSLLTSTIGGKPWKLHKPDGIPTLRATPRSFATGTASVGPTITPMRSRTPRPPRSQPPLHSSPPRRSPSPPRPTTRKRSPSPTTATAGCAWPRSSCASSPPWRCAGPSSRLPG